MRRRHRSSRSSSRPRSSSRSPLVPPLEATVCYARTVIIGGPRWRRARSATRPIPGASPHSAPSRRSGGRHRADCVREVARPASPIASRGADRSTAARVISAALDRAAAQRRSSSSSCCSSPTAPSAPSCGHDDGRCGDRDLLDAAAPWFLDNPYHAGVGGLRPVAMERGIRILDQEAVEVGTRFTIPCDERGIPD